MRFLVYNPYLQLIIIFGPAVFAILTSNKFSKFATASSAVCLNVVFWSM